MCSQGQISPDFITDDWMLAVLEGGHKDSDQPGDGGLDHTHP